MWLSRASCSYSWHKASSQQRDVLMDFNTFTKEFLNPSAACHFTNAHFILTHLGDDCVQWGEHVPWLSGRVLQPCCSQTCPALSQWLSAGLLGRSAILFACCSPSVSVGQWGGLPWSGPEERCCSCAGAAPTAFFFFFFASRSWSRIWVLLACLTVRKTNHTFLAAGHHAGQLHAAGVRKGMLLSCRSSSEWQQQCWSTGLAYFLIWTCILSFR